MGPRLARVVRWIWTNDPADTLIGGFLVLGLAAALLIILVGTIWSFVL